MPLGTVSLQLFTASLVITWLRTMCSLFRISQKNNAKIGCRMSHKVHILDAHLDQLKVITQRRSLELDYSKEKGERFYQDILDFERRYQVQHNEKLSGDYIWGHLQERDLQCTRKSRVLNHFQLILIFCLIIMRVLYHTPSEYNSFLVLSE